MFRKTLAEHEPLMEKNWQKAADRALLYLRCLNFPPLLSFELVLKALRIVEEKTGTKNGEAYISNVLQVLEQLVKENRYSDRYVEPHSASQSEPHWIQASSSNKTCRLVHIRSERNIPSTPPLCRLSMVPAKFRAQGWGSAFVSWFTHGIVG